MSNNIILDLLQFSLFMLTLFGFAYLFSTMKVDIQFAPVCSVSAISVFLVLGGIFNYLLYFSYFLYGFGIFLFFIGIINGHYFKKDNRFIYLILILSAVFYGMVFYNGNIGFNDSFSHWALLPRLMQYLDRIPNAKDAAVTFRDYPIGIPVLFYFGGIFNRYREGLYMFINGMIVTSAIISIIPSVIIEDSHIEKAHIDVEKSDKLFIIFVIFYLTASLDVLILPISTLYADVSLPVVAFALYNLVRKNRKNIGRTVIPYIVTGSFLLSIKQSGLIFFVFSSFFIIYYSIRYRNGFIFAVISVVFPVLYRYIWNVHCRIVFKSANAGMDIFDMAKYRSIYEKKGRKNVDAIIKLFIDANKFDVFWLFILTLLIISIIFLVFKISRKSSKIFVSTMIFSVIAAILYQMYVLFTYIYLVPLEDGVKLSGYNVYSGTIRIYLFLVIVNLLLIYYPTFGKWTRISIFSAMLVSIFVKLPEYREFVQSPDIRMDDNSAYVYREQIISRRPSFDNEKYLQLRNRPVLVISPSGFEVEKYLVVKYLTLSNNITIKTNEDAVKMDKSRYFVIR